MVEERLSAIELLYKSSLPKTITIWLSAGIVSKGKRGELAARLLFTITHDIAILWIYTCDDPHGMEAGQILFSNAVPVIEFLSSLIPPEHFNAVLDVQPQNVQHWKSLKEAFKKAYVQFTHFVRGRDNFVVTDKACVVLFSRSARVTGHATLAALNLIIPICFYNERLS